MNIETTRRALLGGAGLASVALITPAVAAVRHAGSAEFRAVMDANDDARHRFNHLPQDLEDTDDAAFQRETDRMIEASRAADQATPTNWREFTRLLNQMCDGGWSNIDGDNAERLLAHANRLLSKGA